MEDGYHPITEVEQRILFVEDLSADVELSVRELKRAGIACAARRVETEQDFRRELEQFSPDLIISDFSIPGFQGMDALMIARDLCPDTPYIFVSGTIGEETAIESLKLGATDYVLKSNPQRLGPSVLRALQESRERAARAEMSEALKNSEERFRQLAESIHDVFWLTDLSKNQMLYVSPAYEEIWGRSRSRLYTSPWEWAEALHPEDRERVLSAVQTKQITGIADDITERKRSEEKLRESESKFRQLIEQASDGIMISDKYGNFVLVNTRGCELLGYAEEELVGMNGRETYVEGDRENHTERMQAVRNGETLRFERMVRRKDGSAFPAEVSIKMLDSSMVQVIFHDISTRRAHEQKIARLSRIQGVLSGINSAIVRIRDRKELFEEACLIAVDHGGFRMAWIGLIDKTARKVEPIAWSGFDDGFLSDVALLSFADDPDEEQGLVAQTVRTQSPQVVNDIETDPAVRRRKECLDRGYRSVVILPLATHGEVVGLLSLYAAEPGIFDDEEMKLLTDLAADISFSLEYMGKNEELNFLAYHDALTGLPNRTLYLERLGDALETARDTDTKVAVMFGDIRRFRYINDTFGRRAGDARRTASSPRRVLPAPGSNWPGNSTASSIATATFVTVISLRRQRASANISPTASAWRPAPGSIAGAAARAASTICPTAKSGRRSITNSRRRQPSMGRRPGWMASRSLRCSTRRRGHSFMPSPRRGLRILSSHRLLAARRSPTAWMQKPPVMNWGSTSPCREAMRSTWAGAISIRARSITAANTTATRSALAIYIGSVEARR